IQPPSTPTILNYLKSTRESKDGELDHPIPQLRGILLHGVRASNTPYEDLLADIAQARPKIRSIKIHNRLSPALFVSGCIVGRVKCFLIASRVAAREA
ncbi:hypothetical protein M407DRAFT_214274, partial [Tulasnella calospora MUT 4182]